jgi:hypothetical protein
MRVLDFFSLERPMRSIFLFGSMSIITLAFGLHGTEAGDAKKQIKPTQQWSGKGAKDELAKLAPKAGYITDQKTLNALWADWMRQDKVPTPDFGKQIVFVQLATGGPNVPRPTYKLDNKGNLTVLSISTLIGGPGFGYSIDLLNREGIKTYQGKAIEEPKKK